ncbi:MAG: hypothetical protein ACOX4Q_00685 [Syntrophomonadales bacterium]
MIDHQIIYPLDGVPDVGILETAGQVGMFKFCLSAAGHYTVYGLHRVLPRM